MKKNLSLLKPDVQSKILCGVMAEKAEYLNIPMEIDLSALRADVKAGALQFSELEWLIEKENEPKYILISANNLEQGYLAVTYLAAGFNRKHNEAIEILKAECEEEEKENDQSGVWTESPFRIPLIMDNDLLAGVNLEDNCNIFPMNNMFMQGSQNAIVHTPYWMNCRQNAVCIVADEANGWGGLGFGYTGGYRRQERIINSLEYFKENDKVYILRLEPYISKSDADAREEEEMQDGNTEYVSEGTRAQWNHIVLSLAADEVAVRLDQKGEKRYYKQLLKGNFDKKGITVKKGFSYERIVNIFAAMADEKKCALAEKIVTYAVKDWKSPGERPIENNDFRFIDRFCRVGIPMEKKGERRKSARERLMQELVGMEDVKRQILNVVNVMKYNQIRERMGLRGGGYHNVHVMLGAPGTAKTTAARLMGQIMVEEQLLPDDRYVCLNGAELKGKYVGHSAPKTKAVFENNDIIVIDEAYSLVEGSGENDSFAQEALAQLIVELENHSMDKLVIFAGYGGKHVSEKNNKMKEFLDANPGIRSRINSTICFDSYSPDEMVQIFYRIAENSHYKLDERAGGIVRTHFQKRVGEENFGNGREARRLLETAVIYTAERVLGQNKTNYTRAEMQTISLEDVERAVGQEEYADNLQKAGQNTRILGFRAT